MKTEINWNYGTPTKYGMYLVATVEDIVSHDTYSAFGWECHEDVICWCNFQNITPPSCIHVYTVQDMSDMLRQIGDYYEACESDVEKMYYLSNLAETALFQDAIGKPIGKNESRLTVISNF